MRAVKNLVRDKICCDWQQNQLARSIRLELQVSSLSWALDLNELEVNTTFLELKVMGPSSDRFSFFIATKQLKNRWWQIKLQIFHNKTGQKDHFYLPFLTRSGYPELAACLSANSRGKGETGPEVYILSCQTAGTWNRGEHTEIDRSRYIKVGKNRDHTRYIQIAILLMHLIRKICRFGCVLDHC